MLNPGDIDGVIQEAIKMRYFDHPNVLGLIGVSINAGEVPYLVMPFMANGSLLSYLKKERANLTIAEGANEDLVGNPSLSSMMMFVVWKYMPVSVGACIWVWEEVGRGGGGKDWPKYID